MSFNDSGDIVGRNHTNRLTARYLGTYEAHNRDLARSPITFKVLPSYSFIPLPDALLQADTNYHNAMKYSIIALGACLTAFSNAVTMTNYTASSDVDAGFESYLEAYLPSPVLPHSIPYNSHLLTQSPASTPQPKTPPQQQPSQTTSPPPDNSSSSPTPPLELMRSLPSNKSCSLLQDTSIGITIRALQASIPTPQTAERIWWRA